MTLIEDELSDFVAIILGGEGSAAEEKNRHALRTGVA